MKNFLSNKYTKLYFNIITNANSQSRDRNKDTYYEKHHIYPKSLYPELEKDLSNLVYLTAREHFICHYLLCKMVKSGSSAWHKMVRAFTFMYASNNKQVRYINSRLYELARKNIGVVMSSLQSGTKNSQFGTVWIYSDSEKHSIKVPKNELELYLAQGYHKGRKVTWEDPVHLELKKIDKQIQKLTERKLLLLGTA